MIKAKKSLGQNFLKDDAVLQRIIESANLSKNDVVIEIGPGHGVLTELLARKCKKVIAIELDDRLIEMLRNKLRNKENVEIIHNDILKINLPELVSKYEIQDTRYKTVANIPYYITAPIIRLLLETKIPPSEMILMVQKEVAERICAKAGEMSILAVSVQYYAQPEYLFTVPKTAFDPMPKVDSAVIRIVTSNQQPVISKKNNRDFFRVVRAGFSAKRKTLVNNLANGLQLDKKTVEEKLIAFGFSKNTRAQELGVEDWQKLIEFL
ncbi:MAG TPA: 16S rRNA (adenine(1518)-N(6)/adenine(1519)-N(6))-dimethyltransferase RsmA [Candidatus Moranbacteria bacterium]|nr:16S rRNA (adenine(1518)-N(6)/adenine(1519)-N(6))-dimethyltransferase RsmA [Candidatus Moranbacteria bacterium]HRY27622.1 16S rRNA (adenine(1518)-N(6)/adenine(1519)-N(6))-dimethyltransferase RsmA [Candidatus Moranbacteria bacterium]HSA07851.1 16S rRNA (adenine(1518)-N(6)/adenine(1519)-N(6))-dimethyltransferase RsmA [Candidatus Moranbacteria bacterium]